MHTTACVTPVMEYWLEREITAAYGGGGEVHLGPTAHQMFAGTL